MPKSRRNTKDHLANAPQQELELIAKQTDYQPTLIAKRYNVGLRQSQRIFFRRFGITPTEWCRRLRSKIALVLINEGLSSNAIAKELRFADTSHFCHEFKKVYGVSPRAFRVPSPSARGSRQDVAHKTSSVSRFREYFFASLTLS